ncbi:FAD-dependent oxidoreductase [Streptomyces sp. NPDC056160]|uniref:FAD-dependent oxidoreductase n=1 Tax=Streptomyces sp. NPDC056160 TaxID=3345731 RepID=UPI0035DC615B
MRHLADYSLFGHSLYQQPVLDGRLHWASTEAATEYAGHIEGALAAGERAARAVLAAVHPAVDLPGSTYRGVCPHQACRRRCLRELITRRAAVPDIPDSG